MKEKLMIFKDDNIDFKRTIYLLLIILVISGIFGFIYETIFYRIDLGYFTKRGTTYGPWIPIYAYGGVLITIMTYRFRKNPFTLFIINTIMTGILEYITGFLILKLSNKRLWDYNVEKWNYGNINGFICLRSILFFGLSSLLLIYLIIPFIKKVTENMSLKSLALLSLIPSILFFVDEIIYAIRH